MRIVVLLRGSRNVSNRCRMIFYNMGAYLVSTGVCCVQEASRRSPGPALKNWESNINANDNLALAA